ncbi:uncharacterized protein [Musca autumnalis]|uniref:uncharacterized protein n=1 Tax=Musca autumnalis TaxID=221902 RepID=UPI003CED7681
MNTKDGSISKKDKEKLKRKLMNLLKEHESKTNRSQEKLNKRSERGEAQEESKQQVSGNKGHQKKHKNEMNYKGNQGRQREGNNNKQNKSQNKNMLPQKRSGAGSEMKSSLDKGNKDKPLKTKVTQNDNLKTASKEKEVKLKNSKIQLIFNEKSKQTPNGLLKREQENKTPNKGKEKVPNKKQKNYTQDFGTTNNVEEKGPNVKQKKNIPAYGDQQKPKKKNIQTVDDKVNYTKAQTPKAGKESKGASFENALPNTQNSHKKRNKNKSKHMDKSNSTNTKETDTSQTNKSTKVPLKSNGPASKKNNLKKETNTSQGTSQKTAPPPKAKVNNNQTMSNKYKQKKTRKRSAPDVATNYSKKPKLVVEEKQPSSSKRKSKRDKKNKLSFSSSSDTSHLDTKNMSGFVGGGDFDSKYGEYSGDSYWEQQYADFNTDSDDYESQRNQEVSLCKKHGDEDYDSDDDEHDDPYNYSDMEDSDDDNGAYNYDDGDDSDDDDGGHNNYGDSYDSDDDNDPYNYSGIDDSDDNFNDYENHDDVGDDPYDYSDLDVEDYDTDEEEEEEHYSDFDEDDYEEDEDSYDYSDSEYSSNYEDHSDDDFEHNGGDDEEHDEDYKLPENVPEDLIIHSGTATKRDLQPEDNVVFKDKKYCQIIELECQETVKTIQQPEGYKKEELLKLKYKENHSVNIPTTTIPVETNKNAVNSSDEKNNSTKSKDGDDDDCPKLVPIIDEDGFQLYNPHEDEDEEETLDDESSLDNEEQDSYEYGDDDSMENVSLGSEYTELDSDEADSLMSEDINEKYLNRNAGDYDDSSDDDGGEELMPNADVIDATKCTYAGNKNKRKFEEDMEVDSGMEELPSQMLNKHIKVGSKAKVLSTIVVDEVEKKEVADDTATNSQTENENNTNFEEANKEDNNEEVVTSNDEKPLPASVDNNTEKTPHEMPTVRSKIQHQSLAHCDTVFCNAINANLVLVLVKDPIYIYGTVRLTLLAGHVEIYGHTLSLNKEIEIFSPRGCSVIEISSNSAKSPSLENNLKEILKIYQSNFILSDLENIAKSYEPNKDAVVLMKRNDERRKVVSQFKKFMNENVFPNLQNINTDRPLYNSEYLLRCMINTSAMEQKCLHLPEQWRLLDVTAKSRILLAGGKGVGKSTLLRYLINKQLPKSQKVLLIDLDIGQPEIFVPQTVSCSVVTKPLLGPGFFLNIQPDKAFAVGHTNIALCAHRYTAAVHQLIDHCRAQEEFQGIPWFVNTMGYNKGFGLELISVIIKALPLTDVVQLQSNKDINNFDSLLFPQTVDQVSNNMFMEYNGNPDTEPAKLEYRTHVWRTAVTQESRYQKEWDMSPKDTRYAMLLTRLSVALQDHAEWLADCKPLSAPLDQLKLLNLMDNKPPSSQDELAKAMEANLVYLCHVEDDNETVECLGIGVVRAIDFHVRQVYLVPAFSTPLLKHVNCLALGDMPLPSSILTNQGSRVNKTAPFVYNTIEANASKAIKQIYHRPKLFLSGKHKSLGV